MARLVDRFEALCLALQRASACRVVQAYRVREFRPEDPAPAHFPDKMESAHPADNPVWPLPE